MQLQYTILQYAPFQSTTTIALGILFHEPSLDFREFRYTSDLSQFETQCPEIDVKVVEKLLRGIKEEVESAKSFDIEDFTRFYLNDFQFGEISYSEFDCLENIIEHLIAIHL